MDSGEDLVTLAAGFFHVGGLEGVADSAGVAGGVADSEVAPPGSVIMRWTQNPGHGVAQNKL